MEKVKLIDKRQLAFDNIKYNRWYYEFSCGHFLIWSLNFAPNYCPHCGKKVSE